MTDPFTRSTHTYRSAQATNQARGRPGFEVMPRPPSKALAYLKVAGAGIFLFTTLAAMVIAWA